MTPSRQMTLVGALLTAAGLFSLLTGILETVRIYTSNPSSTRGWRGWVLQP